MPKALVNEHKSSRTAFLKSFGRRQAYESLEARTRGPRVVTYGDFGFWQVGVAADLMDLWSSVAAGQGKRDRPMCENTLKLALQRVGYGGARMTAHGFRSMASTLLNESRQWTPDAIERQLAHVDANAGRRIYARGEYWDERVRMMQAWSDELDRLRANASATDKGRGVILGGPQGTIRRTDRQTKRT